MRCRYCSNIIDELKAYYYSDSSGVSHPLCYYRFIGGNKLNLDWQEDLK